MFMGGSVAARTDCEIGENESENEQNEPGNSHQFRVRNLARPFWLCAENRGDGDESNRQTEHHKPTHGIGLCLNVRRETIAAAGRLTLRGEITHEK
jgi:hypothetical protein